MDMTYYGAKHMADSFRTVRKNTVTLAEEIPADHRAQLMPVRRLLGIVPHLTRQRDARAAART